MAQPHDEPTEELLDAVEATGELIGPLPRSVVHAQGLWHQVFHCLVVRSAPPARLLLQRRRHTARAFPGLLDLSVTGHLAAGEQPTDGVREIREELGLTVDPARLVPLGRRLVADDTGEGRNREIAHQFLLVDDTPLGELHLDPDEVAGFVELAVDDLLAIVEDPSVEAPAFEVDTAGHVRAVICRAGDLVPADDGSWTAIALMAVRAVSGRAG